MDSIGRCFWDARGRLGYSFLDVARLLGADSPRQEHKAMLWLTRLEQEGLVEGDESFLPELLAVLEIDPEEFQAIVERKRQRIIEEFEEWVSQPEEVTLYWKAMPAIWVTKGLGFLSEEEACAWVSERAVGARDNLFVKLNRRIGVWFEAGTGRELRRVEETPFTSHLPVLRIGNKTVSTLFSSGSEVSA